MALYRLRFFFDPGSGTCRWAGNDAARARWDYPIDARALPVPPSTGDEAHRLCRWFDIGIDWDRPLDTSPWDAAERARFDQAAQVFLRQLRAHLGPDFEVVDESRTSVSP